jgi:predicted lipoprotein with Yx(FWY)xxD motif
MSPLKRPSYQHEEDDAVKLFRARHQTGSRHWNRALAGAAGLAAIAALLAACGGGGSDNNAGGSTGSGSGAAAVKTSPTGSLGAILVNSAGKTLYFADGESAGSIKCTGECVGFWSPLTTSGNAAPQASGDLTAQFTMVKRPGGGDMQVAYNGHPLYTFKLDKSAGSTMGNDFKDSFGGTNFTWHAVTAAGAAAAEGGSNSTPSSSPSYSDSDGSGY